MPKISCIYQITSATNGKRYIGSSADYSSRKSSHFCLLRRNIHNNGYLQNHCNKYGIEDLSMSILEEVADPSKLIEREQYYLDTLDPEFNICKVAGSTTGTHRTLSEETRKKMSAAHIGKTHTEEHKQYMQKLQLGREQQHSREVVQLDKDGNLICIYRNMHEAARQTGAHRTHISATCRGKAKTAGGYIWKYKEDYTQ